MNALSLSFKDTNFQITDINGQPWLRGYQIGNALEYSDGAVAIAKLYDRNADEFTDSMTQVIELPTAGGKQQVRVFSLRGCHLLGMLARTKVAKEFRRWVLDVLEETLLNGKVSDGPAAKTTADDRTPLRQAVAALVGRKGIDYSTAYGMIHQRFNVGAIEDIPAEKLPEAVAYVHALTLHTGLVGEVLDREPLSAPQPALPIDGNSLADIAAMVYYGTWMIELGKDISAPLKQLGNRQAVTMWTVWHETRSRLKRAVAALEVLRKYADKDTSDRIAVSLEGIYSKATVR
nr:MAG TPA: BRO family protein [Caudoviricetes sp.]